jgi:caffeoyl-CoA O-methyltransferase
MKPMTPERWQYTCDYSSAVFGAQDPHLANLMKDAVAHGLPDIAVSADVGRLLQILTSTTPGRLAIEVGTLAGYSGIWIARGLAPHGRLITIEPNPLHADFARDQFKRAGVGERVTIHRGAGLEVLPQLARELGPKSVDIIFLDAVKSEYPQYWNIVQPLISVGGFILADNVYGSDDWWIDDEGHASRQGADAFNRAVAADPDFTTVAVPLRAGLLLGRRMK